MVCAWLPFDDLAIYLVSLAFAHIQRREECSAARRRASFAWSDRRKSPLRSQRALAHGINNRKPSRVRDLFCGEDRIYLKFELRRVWCRYFGVVKQEKLPWLADSLFYTKRFALFGGRRCRTTTIPDVARELHQDGRAVKELDGQYMREQLRRNATPGPKAIGI